LVTGTTIAVDLAVIDGIETNRGADFSIGLGVRWAKRQAGVEAISPRV